MLVKLLILFTLSSALLANDGIETTDIEERFAALGGLHIPLNFNLNGQTILTLPEFLQDQPVSLNNQLLWGFDVYGGLDMNNEIYSSLNYGPNNSNQVYYNQNQGPYIFIKKMNYSLGIGAELRYFITQEYRLDFGIVPLFGRMKVQKRILENLQEKEHLKNLKVPKNLQELKDWKRGEALTWGAEGGALMSFAVRTPPIGRMGVYAVVKGNFQYEVEKISEHMVMATLKRNKISAITTGYSNVAINAEIGSYIKKIKGHRFYFDFNEEESIKDFKKFLEGDLTVSKKTYTTHLYHDESFESLSTGNSRGVALKVPMLYKFMLNTRKEVTHKEIETTQSKTSLYQFQKDKEKATRGYFSKHLINVRRISTLFVEHLDKKSKEIKNYLNVNVSCFYKRDLVKVNKLKKVYHRCLEDVSSDSDNPFPKFKNEKEKSLRATLSLSFNANSILEVLSFKNESMSFAALYSENEKLRKLEDEIRETFKKKKYKRFTKKLTQYFYFLLTHAEYKDKLIALTQSEELTYKLQGQDIPVQVFKL